MSSTAKNQKKSIGRPSKYKSSLCGEVVRYLRKTSDLPTIEDFVDHLGVAESTVYLWAKKHGEFSEALERIKRAQKRMLINMGLSGQYNATIAKLILSSNHGMCERKDITTKNQAVMPDRQEKAHANAVLQDFLQSQKSRSF